MKGTYLVECYWPGVTEAMLIDAAARAAVAADELRAAGTDIRFLGSLLVPDDEVAFCRFAAASAADVEHASTQANLRFDRVLECVELPSR